VVAGPSPGRTASTGSHTAPDPQPAPTPASPQKAEEYQRYLASGKKALQAQSYDEALKAFERAAYADRTQADPYKEIGLLYQMKGDNKLAAEHFQRYVDSIPTPPDADSIRKVITRLAQ
jgi:regulator of sirC expression with transglutaminase-like and TPR domain